MDHQSGYLWWKYGVVYQIYPRSYQDHNGDGIGDLAGIIQRLDYLHDTLGVDAIWLSPFYPSPMADFGYDVADYCDVDPMFGDLETFDRLLAEAHARSIHIIIDFVPNHTSDQHAWFLESRASRDNPKRDWYVWRDARPDGSLPNNWLSNFGGPAWEWDEATGQYYLHSFLKEQPDLNWRNPEVKQAMFNVVRFWLERGVDGFRLDVAHYIMKDPDLRDNPPNPDYDPARDINPYSSQLDVHNKGHADVHTVFREFRQLLDEYSQERPRYSVGEIHIFDWQRWSRYYGESLDELHMPFNFALIHKLEWNARAVQAIVDGLEGAIPDGAWPNYVMGNHDERRLASRYGKENARLAAMLLLTLRGTPTIYYGEEIGMEDVPIPPEKEQDPYGIRVPGKGRDVCRTPMQWDDSLSAGFSEAQPEQLWLPVAENYQEVNAARQLEQPGSILNLYRQLLALRKANPALHAGSYQALDGAQPDCYVYLRQDGEQRCVVALNFSTEDRLVRLPGMGRGRVALATGLDQQGEIDLEGFTLQGREGLIITL